MTNNKKGMDKNIIKMTIRIFIIALMATSLFFIYGCSEKKEYAGTPVEGVFFNPNSTKQLNQTNTENQENQSYLKLNNTNSSINGISDLKTNSSLSLPEKLINGSNNSLNTSDILNQTTEKNTSNTPTPGYWIDPEIRYKSNSRATSFSLWYINLNDSDFTKNHSRKMMPQCRNLTAKDLEQHDGYGTYLLEGNMAVYLYDENVTFWEYSKMNNLVYVLLLRYQTDYVDDFIKNKKFETQEMDIFTANVGEYSRGYSEVLDGTYQSKYVIEFFKYDTYARVEVDSKELIMKQEDVLKYARIIESRIRK